MRIHLLLLVCIGLFWKQEVSAEFDNEIRRGAFPFVAVLYYPDESIVDSTGARFQHAAVLIKLQWLVSAAIDHAVLDNVPLGFPRKTLLARLGAITLDSNYTLNEDEDEQEREVIQVVRPSNHNPDKWWSTDVTLLQTLLPFKQTSAVAPTTLSARRDFMDKNCLILVFAKKLGNTSDEKLLMQLSVELLPPSADNCGAYFDAATMTCAVQAEESKTAVAETEFCQGNSGGPLLCEGEVMGLQTYIENNCKQQPHLYQVLSYWDTFLSCGTEGKCNPNDHVCKICTAVHKDSPMMQTPPHTPETNAPPLINISMPSIDDTTPPLKEETTVTIQTFDTNPPEIDTKTITDYVTKEPSTEVSTEDTMATNAETKAVTNTEMSPTEPVDTTIKEETSSTESSPEDENARKTEGASSTTTKSSTSQKKLYWPHYKQASSTEEEDRTKDIKVQVEAQQRGGTREPPVRTAAANSHPHLKQLSYLLIALPISAHFI